MPSRRRRLPPLERKFGFFSCSCDATWASAYVFCILGTKKVYFKQKCRNCNAARNPYRVENLKCPGCGMDRDECECDDYELEDTFRDSPRGVHRNDLCEKCLAGYPCKDYDYCCSAC